ncbi:MAG: N-formylglutamate amidohydrolase [Gammaproteobacteria bacterium]|nr:MAG: N-formylglutamate amidohydrolase [Gammaproteobacteria bacterium]
MDNEINKNISPIKLLADDEPPAFEIVNTTGSSQFVLVCDHASKRVPLCLNNLGLTDEQLDDHVGWDPGAAEVARLLSKNLNAPLVLSGYSRLVIDCNRPLQSVQSIPEQSAGVMVPGNQKINEEERALRVNDLFHPYHNAITELLESRKNRTTFLLSIHSFTPVLNNQQRPWNIGVSFWRDNYFAKKLITALSQSKDIVVGDNEPYAIDAEFDYAVPVHGEARGLPSAMLEIRQDGIRSVEGVANWAGRITQACLQIK